MTKACGARQSAIEGRSLTLESVKQKPGQAGMRRATMMNRTARYVGVEYDAALHDERNKNRKKTQAASNKVCAKDTKTALCENEGGGTSPSRRRLTIACARAPPAREQPMEPGSSGVMMMARQSPAMKRTGLTCMQSGRGQPLGNTLQTRHHCARWHRQNNKKLTKARCRRLPTLQQVRAW
jgi:hypothetical protein